MAYFITWTTYGTWLPGDVRGWRKSFEGYMPPRPKLERWCRDQLSEPPVYLDVAERSVVKAACERHSKIRGWHVHALNPRTNHVHILITASDTKPEIVRDQLKANATGDLRRARLRFLTRY